jgi:hypothetical protein
MGEIINFSDKKTAMDRDRSDHFLSLDLFMNSDTSELWARVDNAGEVDIDPEWHRFIAKQLRQLAWIADGMAARNEGTETAPIACVTVFEDSRVNTMHNDDMVETDRQADWVGEQLAIGCDEIRAALKERKDV